MTHPDIDKAVESMCYDKAKIVHANSTHSKKHIKLNEPYKGFNEILIKEFHDYFSVWNADGNKCLTLLAKPDYSSEMVNVQITDNVNDHNDVLRQLGYQLR